MRRVVVIDDDYIVRVSLAAMLRAMGLEVETAKNGDEGIAALRDKQIDGVITDIIMPDRDGIETIAEIRKMYPRIKIVAISGGGRIGNVDYFTCAEQMGADAVLKKPFGKKELWAIINKVSGGAQ